MVRNYVRKTAGPAYSKEDVQKAKEMIESGRSSLHAATKLFHIPKSSMSQWITGSRGVKSATMGRSTIIPAAEEKRLADCLKKMNKWGFGLSKKEMLSLVGKYVTRNNISTPFKDELPGDDFFNRFMKMHNLSLKKQQAVEVSRKKGIDPFIIADYFQVLKDVTSDVPPAQIYNIDETSFCLDPSRIKVVGERGCSSHRITNGPGKENITVLLGSNAAGDKLPPLIIFTGGNLWDAWIPAEEAAFPGTTYAATKNGWMEATVFENYFVNSFLKSIPNERPVVLILDGHTSHISLTLMLKAREAGVIILKLPPHSSHKLQPMDLAVFGPLKLKWDEEIIKWQRTHYGCKLSKLVFAIIILKIWINSNPQNRLSGFRKAGIYPYNPNVIEKEEYDIQQYKRFIERNNQPTTDSVAPSLPSAPSVSALSHEILASTSTSTPSTSSVTYSFEELLLEEIKQRPLPKTTRKKVCSGAEVLTSDEVVQRLQILRTNNQKTAKKRNIVGEGIDSEADDPNPISPINQRSEKKTSKFPPNRPSKKRKFVCESSDDDSSCSDLDEAKKIESILQKEASDDDSETFSDLEDEQICPLEVNDFVIIVLDGKKDRKVGYVAQVQEMKEAITVSYLRRSQKTINAFIFPKVPDISTVPRSDIVYNLKKPVQTGTKRQSSLIKFNYNFDYLSYKLL
ncbi:hypothetical protein V9T40_006993 [Parthenolecanium corni]|uniref:DDE-1 domain-containing protein n=1 Tax=Parthenolecanium corni TaxID=536013 RepID=A0AAN9YBQ7_9HEMI